MKKLQAPIAGLFLLLFSVSCRKDLKEKLSPEIPPAEVSTFSETKSENITESEWTGSATWNSVDQSSHSVLFTNIKANVTADAAENGMIRVFKSSTTDPSSIQALPFEETVNGNRYYWYYQVTEGNILIMVDAYGSKDLPKENILFKSVVLDPVAVSEFEAKGSSKADLMKMPLEALSENN